MLIVSSSGDWSAEQVAKQLEGRAVTYSWFDPADFPQRVQVAARLGRSWYGDVATPDGTFAWEDISAVFYRRPRDFEMPSGMSGPERRFARSEARVGLGGVLASLPVKWINHPSALTDCEYKPWQLSLAQTVGLRVPATIVTNVPDEVRRFAAEVGDLIVKPLAEPIIAESGTQKTIWTRRVAAAELIDLAGLELTAHLFQEWIPKAYEIRLTIVGKHHFGVAIHAHSTSTQVDWRSDYDALTYDVIECPTDVADRARAFLSAAGLTYGAFDFIVTALGDSPACLADLHVLEGRALASLGETRAAVGAVVKAEQTMQFVVPENEPEWARFIDVPYVFGEASHCFRDLGQSAEIDRFASESAAVARQQGRARRGALSHTALAISHLNQGEVEASAAKGVFVVDLARSVNSSRCIEAVRDLQRRLRPYSSIPEVQHFNTYTRDHLGVAP